jgi:nucleotide-binding universal stress UspA family protein
MYKRILVPTDGSKLSRRAIVTAVKLAKKLRARLTGVYVIPPYTPSTYGDGAMYTPELSPARHRENWKRAGKKALEAVVSAARAAGVARDATMLVALTPWEGIVSTARSKKCDLIVMASHGRRGLAGLLLGSETVKVLTHSRIPVLVCR